MKQKQLKKKKTKEQALAALKKRTLEILSKEERYSMVRSSDGEGMLILEEGRGVVDVWNWRKVAFLQRLVSQEEIDQARTEHKEGMLDRSLKYLATFQQGARVSFYGVKGWYECCFVRFMSDYNVKAKINILRRSFEKDEEGKTVCNEWTETATVWTEDLKLYK